jgi:hypothetical protein
MTTASNNFEPSELNPLKSLDVWEDDVLERYPDPQSIATDKSTEAYRNYENPEKDTVREFYRLNHIHQSYDFVLNKKAEYLKFDKKEMPVWDAFQFLNQLVDDSDPFAVVGVSVMKFLAFFAVVGVSAMKLKKSSYPGSLRLVFSPTAEACTSRLYLFNKIVHNIY